MRLSTPANGRAGAAVEQFIGALSLPAAARLGGWIAGRGENGQSAGGLDLGAENAAEGAPNGGQRIRNLLSGLHSSLICNIVGSHYQFSIGGQVAGGGDRLGFEQGGRGSRAARCRCPYNPSAAAKSFGIAHGSENRAPKKEGGAGGHPTKTQHTTMSKPRCSQCGLTTTIDCMEEGCPGVAGFHPSTWARPLIQMALDLEHYESLLLKLSDCMDLMTCFDECGQVARLICDEAQKIQKKRGGA